MSQTDGQDCKAKLQRRDADQQAAEWDGDPLGLLLAINPSGPQGRRLGIRVDRENPQKFINESLAANPGCRGLGSVDPVDEFSQPNEESAAS